MLVTWLPTRWRDWCISEDDKKGIEPIFICEKWEKCFYYVSIVFDLEVSKHFGTKNYV